VHLRFGEFNWNILVEYIDITNFYQKIFTQICEKILFASKKNSKEEKIHFIQTISIKKPFGGKEISV